MIIAQQKQVQEIADMIKDYKKVLVLGCNGCVAVCLSGGEKETGILASALRLHFEKLGKDIEILEGVVERQCEREWLEEIAEEARNVDAVVSIACGVGVQGLAAVYPTMRVYPGQNTQFMGMPEEQGIWWEKCAGCGNCILHLTGGICPVARCSKSLLNGPCGGSDHGKCEIDRENIPCGWQLIYDRLKALGCLELMDNIIPAKDWSTSRSHGVRRSVREDMKL